MMDDLTFITMMFSFWLFALGWAVWHLIWNKLPKLEKRACNRDKSVAN
jgi:hypothetical protein